MIEIRGKKNNAICFASQIDEKALEQIKRMCDYDLTLGSQIRIMQMYMREKVVQLVRQ